MLKTFKIPPYTGVDKVNVSTDWYLLAENDRESIDSALDKSVGDEENLTSYRFNYVGVSEEAYVFVIMNFDDGTTMDFPIVKVHATDLQTTLNFVPDVKLEIPTILSVVNNFPTDGQLVIEVGEIKPSYYLFSKSIVLIFDGYGNPVLKKEVFSSTISIDRNELSSYNPGEMLTVYIYTASTTNLLSSPAVLTVEDNLEIVSLSSADKNIDYKSIYKVVLSDASLTINKIDVLLANRVLKTYTNTDTIFSEDDTWQYDATYTLSISVTDGTNDFLLSYKIRTLPSREVFPIDKNNSYSNEFIDEQLVQEPSIIYTEQLLRGRILNPDGSTINTIKSLSNNFILTVGSGLDIDETKDIIVNTIEDDIASILYTDNNGVRFISILHINIVGTLEKVISTYELPATCCKMPLVVSNTEDDEDINIYIVFKDGGDNTRIKELVSDTDLAILSEVYDESKAILTKIEGERFSIFGDQRSLFIYDYNLRLLDNVFNVPEEYRALELIGSRAINGNLLYFNIDTAILIEYDILDQAYIEHSLPVQAERIVRYRDGSFSILFTDDGTKGLKRIK